MDIKEDLLISKNFNWNQYLLIIYNDLDKAQHNFLMSCTQNKPSPLAVTTFFSLLSIYSSNIQAQFSIWLTKIGETNSKEYEDLKSILGEEQANAFIEQKITIYEYTNLPFLKNKFKWDNQEIYQLVNQMTIVMKAWEQKHGSKDNTIIKPNPSFAIRDNN